MTSAHRKSSSHKRRWTADPQAWINTMAANSDQCPDHATSVVVMVKAAFERLRTGHGIPADFDRVANAINIGLIRAESIDPLAEEPMKSGIAAMDRCQDIWNRHGRYYGFFGPDLSAVRDALELYEGIVRLSKPILMERAIEEVARRMLQRGQGVAV